MDAPVLDMLSIKKVYPDGTVALRGVDFKVAKGDICGLLGENGAGKTTLMKILSGLLPLTAGEIAIRGRKQHLKNPAEALKSGIGMVHQHFALVQPFTGLQNIILGMEEGRLLSRNKLEKAKEKINKLMEDTGLRIPLDTPIEMLSAGGQQRVEILKILYRNVEILILDEPTTNLTPIEVDQLFQMLRNLKKMGKTVIFITHKLREVLEITDCITVLRMGSVVGNILTEQATPEKLAEMMVGEKVVSGGERESRVPGEPILVVDGLKARNDIGHLAVKNISFEVCSGEIFGVAGVEGNGQSELVQAVTGLRSRDGGKILFRGVDIAHKNPGVLYRMGLAHIPEDKRKMGLVLELNVAENSILGMHKEKKFNTLGKLVWQKVYDFARTLIREFGVVTTSILNPAKSLSGGNQQKLVVGRELSKRPSLVVAANPTKGLDVAATQAIQELLVRMRGEGKGIMLVSSDLDEVMQLSDRIAVMYEGNFMGISKAGEKSRKEIGIMMGGVRLEQR